MKIIAHRANIDGPSKAENTPSAIDRAIDHGFDVEIDMWYVDNRFYLGHDKPVFTFKKGFLEEILSWSWIHCKNVEAMIQLQNNYPNSNFFWHENDRFTLTSKGFIWTYPGEQITKKSIIVLPELINKKEIDSSAYGVCTDYPKLYK